MVFLLFACLYTTCMSGAHGNWNGALDPLQLGVTDSCAPPCGCWELDLGTLEDQTVCLTAEPSLQPLRGDVLKSRPYPQFSLLQLDEFDAGIYKFYLMQIFFVKEQLPTKARSLLGERAAVPCVCSSGRVCREGRSCLDSFSCFSQSPGLCNFVIPYPEASFLMSVLWSSRCL